eukprot:m.45650 g.45650  ORF g.45650 m.45650 type:complete len:499 (+) comp33623_c0_seq8:124-1620(+)
MAWFEWQTWLPLAAGFLVALTFVIINLVLKKQSGPSLTKPGVGGAGGISNGPAAAGRSKRKRKSKLQKAIASNRAKPLHRAMYVYTRKELDATEEKNNLCSRCFAVPRKKACSYEACKTCCCGDPMSICHAHRMGSLAALKIVEDALDLCSIEVDLSYQQLKTCPGRLVDLGSIPVTVNLSNNVLKCIPADIGRLDCARELFLQYNCLKRLPNSVGDMALLGELDVKNNQLASLPESIGNLRKLIVFNATNNSLTSLPCAMGQWILLEELCLHANKLTAVPNELCCLTNLECLYLGENQLTALPSEIGKLKKLKELDVSSCQLTVLPDSIAYCRYIEKMWLCNNRLTDLPAQIGRLSKLRELHVKHNQLKVFPASLTRIKLYTFTAYQNPVLDEGNRLDIGRLIAHPKKNFPPLLELAAREVYRSNIIHGPGSIPQELQNFLSSVKTCSGCGGPFFHHYVSDIFFCTVGVFHRVPLYEQICSPHPNSKCKRIVRPKGK